MLRPLAGLMSSTDWDDIKADIGNGVAGTEDYAYYTEYALDIAEADPTLGNTFEDEPPPGGTAPVGPLLWKWTPVPALAALREKSPTPLTSDFIDSQDLEPRLPGVRRGRLGLRPGR